MLVTSHVTDDGRADNISLFRVMLACSYADVQLKLQENLREVQAQSFGGIICCTLPPALRPISASLQPICNTTLAEDLQFKVALFECILYVCFVCLPHWQFYWDIATSSAL